MNKKLLPLLALIVTLIFSRNLLAAEEYSFYPTNRANMSAQQSSGDLITQENMKIVNSRSEKIANLICTYQSLENQNSDVLIKLEAMGVYCLPQNELNNIIPYATEPSNVKINNVNIYYDSQDSTWLVSGGGYWLSDSYWGKDIPLNFLPYVGQQLNVGGYDGVGIKFYKTGGTYNTRVIRSYAYYSDGQGRSFYNYNPSVYDGRKGAYFQYQDKAVVLSTSGLVSSYSYIGKHFAVMLVYDSSFANFNGYARFQYTHTWSSAQINEVSFGASGTTPTFEITIKDAQKSFNCYSTAEAVF